MSTMNIKHMALKAILLALALTLFCATALADSNLLGTWCTADGLTALVFNSGVQATLHDEAGETIYRWNKQGVNVYLYQAGDAAAYTLTYNGFTMKTTMNGQNVVFRKVSDDMGPTPVPTAPPEPGAPTPTPVPTPIPVVPLTGEWKCVLDDEENTLVIMENGVAKLNSGRSSLVFDWTCEGEADPLTGSVAKIALGQRGVTIIKGQFDGMTLKLKFGGEMVFHHTADLVSLPGVWQADYVYQQEPRMAYEVVLTLNEDGAYVYQIEDKEPVNGTWVCKNECVYLYPTAGAVERLEFDGATTLQLRVNAQVTLQFAKQ